MKIKKLSANSAKRNADLPEKPKKRQKQRQLELILQQGRQALQVKRKKKQKTTLNQKSNMRATPGGGSRGPTKRITRQEMFVEILGVVKKRSTCARAQVSALIVKDNRIISTGYGGSPSGLPHCVDVGCEIGENGGCIRTIHAEANAIAFAARQGISTDGSELWCSMSPCLDCAKLIINSGISRVYYLEAYRKRDGIKLLLAAGIKVFHYTPRKLETITC